MRDKTKYQADYDDTVTLNSLTKALNHLVEAKELLDTADIHNAKDDWMGDIPVASIDVQEVAYNLKKLLGVPLTPDDIDLFIDQPAQLKAENAHKSEIQSKDGLGLYQAVNNLYISIEKNDLAEAFKQVEYINNIAKDYADPDSEANGVQADTPAEKTATPSVTLIDTYDIVNLAYNVLRAGNKMDDYGVQEDVKELNTATMNYYADIANQ